MIPFAKRQQKEMPLPDLTPMLDTVFILLFFFVIASAFALHGIDLKLPQSSVARAYVGHPIEIKLFADGTLRYDNQNLTLRDIVFVVRNNAQSGRQIMLIPDRQATVGDFMAAVSTIRDNGGDRLIIAAEPEHAAGRFR